MEQQHERMIVQNLKELVDQTFCSDSFLNLFLTQNVLSKEDAVKIQIERTNKGRYAAAYKFYSIVITRQNVFAVLVQALQETKQTGVLDLLTRSHSSQINKSIKFNKPPLYARNFLLQNEQRILIVYTIDCKLTCDKICDTNDTLKIVSLEDTLTYKVGEKTTPVINCGNNLERSLYYISNVELKYILVTETLNDIKDMRAKVDLNKVNVVHDNFEWDELTSELQTKLMNDVKTHLGLDESICRFALENIDSITLVQLINGKKPIYIKNTIPSEISYYIPRQFVIRNIISGTIFNEQGTDIFFFSGITDEDVPKFPKLNKSITSDGFLNEHILDGRFVILDKFEHFQQISNKFKTRSLHLIEYTDGKLVWKKSKGNITCIEQNLEKRQRLQNGVEFLEDLTNNQDKSPICILDSPGMGKSIILAHLSHELQKQTKNIIAFVVISEFLQQIKINLGNMKKDAATLVTLINYLKGNQLGAAYLENNKDRLEELMFDGFDEIDPDDIALACTILKELRKTFPCTRIWVTTRSHLALELENTLETLGWNLAPFTEKDQIQFLTRYWNRSENTNNEASSLEYFARKCITTLKTSLKQEDLDIAGVPLQCQLIGDVFEEDALSFCSSSHDNFDLFSTSLIRIHSLIELYECVIRKKFENFKKRYEKTSRDKLCIYRSHIDQSIKLIFPGFRNDFKTELEHSLSLQDILDVGFFISQDSLWTTRCIHRTFAEYFIAYFVVETLKTKCSEAMFKLVLENILRTSSVNVKVYTYHDIDSSKYNQNTICYFTNALLKEKVTSDFKRQIVEANPMTVLKITEACIFGGFQSLLRNLLFESISQSQLKYNMFQIKTLFLAVASQNGFIIENVIQMFKTLYKLPLARLQYNTLHKGFTLLHVALTQADYRTVELLVKQEGFEDLLRNSSIIVYITSWLKCNKPDDNVVDNNKNQLIKYLLSYTTIPPYIVTSANVQIAEQALICSRPNFEKNGIPVDLLRPILQMDNPRRNNLLSIIYGNEDICIPVSCQDTMESQLSENTLVEKVLAEIKLEVQHISKDVSAPTSLEMIYLVVIFENREGLDKLKNVMKRVTCLPNITDQRLLHFLKFGDKHNYQVLININQIDTTDTIILSLAKVIFKFGIRLNMLNYHQVTPLVSLVHKVCKNNELEIFDLSKTLGAINPLVAIILRMKYLLSKYKGNDNLDNVDVRDIKNFTLLHIVSRRANINILQKHLPFVLDFNTANDYFETPLMLFAQNPTFCLKCWEVLIDNGADVVALARDETSICRLKSFQYKDSNTCLKALLYALIKLSTCTDGKVETFVCLVVKTFSITIVKCICEWYITTIGKPIQDIQMNLLGNMTILDAALSNIDGLVLEYVWKALNCTKTISAPTMPNLIEKYLKDTYIPHENKDVFIRLSIEMSPELVNTPNDIGLVPLSARRPTIPFVKLLIELGADVNKTDMEGNTPLHWAIKHRSHVDAPNCMELVETLLNFKADPNAENLCYETPVIFALDLGTDDYILACLNILQKHGADLTKFYDNQNTILHLIPHKINLDGFYNFAVFFTEKGLTSMFSIANSDGQTPLEIVQELFYLDKRTIELLQQNGVDVKRFSNFSSTESSSSESDSESSVD